MLKKRLKRLLSKEKEKSKILQKMLDLKNSDLINLKRELINIKIADEEKNTKLVEIQREICKQNYNSSKNLENKILSILKNENTSLNSNLFN